MRNQQEIETQITGLLGLKEKLPMHNFFGENNHAKIDAQIQVLRLEKIADDFYDWSDEDEEGVTSLYDDAFEAEEWLHGRIDKDLFEE